MRFRRKLCLLLLPVILLILYLCKSSSTTNTTRITVSHINEIMAASSYKTYSSDGISYYMYLPDNVLNEINLYAYGPIKEGAKEEDIIKVISNDKEIYLERYYG